MAILICISLYVREMFRFKQISSHGGAAEVFLRMQMKPLIRDY